MAGFLALGNDRYEGVYTSAEDNGIENGQFVVKDVAAKTATLADATTGDGDVHFVVNENDTVVEEAISDADFRIKKGEFLRFHKPVEGEMLVTTNYNGNLAEGDEVAVGANGQVEAIGARTPKTKFVVKELLSAYGKQAIKLEVL